METFALILLTIAIVTVMILRWIGKRVQDDERFNNPKKRSSSKSQFDDDDDISMNSASGLPMFGSSDIGSDSWVDSDD